MPIPKILNPWEILKEIGVVAVFDAVREHFKSEAGKEVASQVFQRVKKSFEESRAELLAFFVELGVEDQTASETLMRRQRDRELLRSRNYGRNEPYKSGDEVKYVNLLTKLYKALDESDEVDKRKEVFKFFGHMPDEEFDAILEFLNHDVVIQWIRRSWGWFKEVWQVAYPAGREFLEKRICELLGVQNIGRAITYSRQREQAIRAEIDVQKQKGRWRRWWS